MHTNAPILPRLERRVKKNCPGPAPQEHAPRQQNPDQGCEATGRWKTGCIVTLTPANASAAGGVGVFGLPCVGGLYIILRYGVER